MGKAQTHGFQTEVNQLLKLMIHSLYSDKEIFLRELISNSSDACDKLRYQSLTNPSLLEGSDSELAVHIQFDKDNRTITVKDNGIGMNHAEVIDNIGTIARSGTKEFLESLTGEKSSDAQLIGQFGVGFYSVFIVSDKVTLRTRKAGEDASQGVVWESDGQGEYTIETVNLDEHGTTITLHLREAEDEFLNEYRLKNIIKKYSEHISLPIYLPAAEDEEDKNSAEDEENKKEADEADLQKNEWEMVNSAQALWSRPKKDITEEEYNHFYTSLTFDSEAPVSILHNKVEGSQDYTSLFFIPKKAPYDLWDRDRKTGIKLYVRRVFIMDDTSHLLPSYLRFVRGLVDAADLPLNVSREFLQENQAIRKIKAASVKKILTELKRLADKDADNYQAFWDEFGKVVKEGVVEDFENKDMLNELLRFASTQTQGDKQTRSLKDYVAAMPESQKSIYYITADTHAAASNSPHLEYFRKNDIEVLLLSDPIDEWLVSHLNEFDGKPLKSIAKGADLEDIQNDESKQKVQDQEKDYADLLSQLKSSLEDKAKDVRLSQRLTDSPACLVADEHELGGNMERILKSIGQDAPSSKPILEINADHPILKNLNVDNNQLDDWAHVLFDQAALSEGAALADPASYVKRVNNLLSSDISPDN